MHVHLRQRQLQGSLGARPFLQCLRVEATLPHLRHRDRDLADARREGLVLEAVGMAGAPLGPLVRGRPEELLALDLHGRVEQDAEQVGHRFQALGRQLLEKWLLEKGF